MNSRKFVLAHNWEKYRIRNSKKKKRKNKVDKLMYQVFGEKTIIDWVLRGSLFLSLIDDIFYREITSLNHLTDQRVFNQVETGTTQFFA